MKRLLLFCTLAALSFSMAVSAQDKFVIKYEPYLQNIVSHEVTIVWVTNRPGVSWVEVAPDDGSHFYAVERPKYFDTCMGKKKIGTLHSVTVDGLKPNTKYRYRIFTKEVTTETTRRIIYGDVASTSVYKRAPLTFCTLGYDDRNVNFVMLCDIHGDVERLTALVNNEPKDSVDFYLYNGDMVSHMNSEQELYKGFLSQSSVLFAKEKPMFMARGNHETRGVFSTRFMDYFPTNTGKPYYAFRHGSVFFVVLDPGEDKPDSDIEYHGLADFDKYRREETVWLKNVLESEECRTAKHRVAVMHIPLFGDNTWHGHAELNKLFVPLLNEANIDLMLCGHEHKYSLIEAGQQNAKFPILVNSNMHSAYMQINDSDIKVRIKDNKGTLVRELNF